MSVNVKVDIDYPAIRRQIYNDPAAKAMLARTAYTLKERGEQFSPVGISVGKSRGGYFKRHWYVRVFRNGFRVGNSDRWAAHLVEFGSMNNPAYSPFRRAMASMTVGRVRVRMTLYPKAVSKGADADG